MRLIYLDPGLKSNLGHHANSCRALTRAFRSLGVEVHTFIDADAPASLLDELQAKPLFRANTYWQSDGDPVCGWLNAFMHSARLTTDDLYRLTCEIEWGDILYLNSGQAAQLYALASWMNTSSATGWPKVHAVFEFGVDPGLDVVASDGTHLELATRDSRVDPRAILYRFAACQTPSELRERLHLACYSAEQAAAYTTLLNWTAHKLPCLQESHVLADRGKRGCQPTVAFLGHQREEKGFQFVPEIIRRVSDRQILGLLPTTFLVHNSDPQNQSICHVQEYLEEMVDRDHLSITLDTAQADGQHWQALLDKSDLVVLPYHAPRYMLSYSAIAQECVAQGIPFVCPANTTMHRLQREYGCVEAAFTEWTAESVSNAVLALLDKLPEAIDTASSASLRWGQRNSPVLATKAILQLAGVNA